jgi:hypothetical protein
MTTMTNDEWREFATEGSRLGTRRSAARPGFRTSPRLFRHRGRRAALHDLAREREGSVHRAGRPHRRGHQR